MKNQFWFNADWKAYSCCARHPVNGVIEYVFLKPIRQRVKLITQRQKQGFFKYYDIYQGV